MSEFAVLRLPVQSCPSPRIVLAYHPAALRGGDRITDLMRKDFEIMRTVLDAARQPLVPADGGVNVGAGDAEQLGLFE